jgi:hypothetical protein
MGIKRNSYLRVEEGVGADFVDEGEIEELGVIAVYDRSRESGGEKGGIKVNTSPGCSLVEGAEVFCRVEKTIERY